MKGIPEDRCQKVAAYVVKTRTTVRQAAEEFNVSKSTVHKDITERLPKLNFGLYQKARKVLEGNKAERHIRGGLANKKKFESQK